MSQHSHKARPLIDGHLDLAYNALGYDRDQELPIAWLRQREEGMTENDRGLNTVCLPELHQGNIGICFTTLLSRSRLDNRLYNKTPTRTALDHASPALAHANAHAQLAYYRQLERTDHMRMLRTREDVADHWTRWTHGEQHEMPVGFVLAMEGADPIIDPDDAYRWFEAGLRMVNLAHYGPNVHAQGTGADGPLTEQGRLLLPVLDELGYILDLTHTADAAFFEAAERFSGQVMASHNNCRSLVPGDRQFSDQQLHLLIQRGAVIGAVCDNWMLTPGYQPGKTLRNEITLQHVANQIDYVCQLAGNSRHAAIGSDLDGGFGGQQSPSDLDTIADLQKLDTLLAAMGYSNEDLNNIFHQNWLRMLAHALPER